MQQAQRPRARKVFRSRTRWGVLSGGDRPRPAAQDHDKENTSRKGSAKPSETAAEAGSWFFLSAPRGPSSRLYHRADGPPAGRPPDPTPTRQFIIADLTARGVMLDTTGSASVICRNYNLVWTSPTLTCWRISTFSPRHRSAYLCWAGPWCGPFVRVRDFVQRRLSHLLWETW